MRLVSAACFVALALSGPVFAFEDELTGLAINLPDTFIVEDALPPLDYLISFGVKNATGAPAAFEGEAHLCSVSFLPDSANAEFTQEQLNTAVQSDKWRDFMQNMLSQDADVGEITKFDLNGISGQEFMVTSREKRDRDARAVMSFLETPKGRTLVSCVTDAETLDQHLEIFRTIRDGVTPPA